MSNSIYVVTEYYTPYLHNGFIEREAKTAFDSFRKAIEYAKGTDGNNHLLKPEDRVDIWLKEGTKPMYDLDTFTGEGIALKVREECINEAAIEQGGYVHKVVIEKMRVH